MTEDLLALIYENAVSERKGAFTLAVEKAQEKLKKFQLPDPRYYITQVFQALLAGGADRIDITVDGTLVKIVFNGPGFTRQELEHIGDAVFESSKNRERDRMRELALGMLSVQALKPKRVQLVSNGFSWTRSGSARPTVSSGPAGQWLEIEHRRSDTNELQILKQNLISPAADVYLNNNVLATKESARAASCPWPNYRFEGPGFRGAFGIAYGDIKASSLLLTRYGVAFSRRTEPRIQPPLIVEMEHFGLRKNASQSDVVEDENYTQMLSQLQKIQLNFSLDLAGKRLPSYQADQVFSYLREVALQHLSQELLELPLEELGPLDRKLMEAPIFPGADGRRYSARDVWLAAQKWGGVLYCPESRVKGDIPPASVLKLTDESANTMRYLFPRLDRLHLLGGNSVQRTLSELSLRASQRAPIRLIFRPLDVGGNKIDLFLPVQPANGEVKLYRAGTEAMLLGRSTLDFALASDTRPNLKGDAPQAFLEKYVAPLYEELMRRPPYSESKHSPLARLRAAIHYLRWKGGAALLGQQPWSRYSLFQTVKQRSVCVEDMRAWLDVYPNIVVTYGPAVNDEDFAVQVTPEALQMLRELFGAERFLLAHLAEPRLVERSQQYGLPNASVMGVTKAETIDEEAELEQIRQEIEAAQSGGFQLREEAPIDEATVMRQLGLKGQSEQPALETVQPFARDCLAAVKQMKTRWLTRFELAGVEGQLVGGQATVPRPLQPNRLLLKVADNEPTFVDLPASLSLSGWLQVPAGWQPPDPAPRFALRPDSSPATLEEIWPAPAEIPSLGDPLLDLDLLWAMRRLFKLAAQNCAQQGPGKEVHNQWNRLLTAYLCWDAGWAASSVESWFFRAPLLRDLLGQWRSLEEFRKLSGPVRWAPIGPGQAYNAAATIRLVPPLRQQDLELWLGKALEPAELHVEEKQEEQLLAEIKQSLVETCQRAECPLEPGWIEGLKFGEPTRWLGGPRRYFIEHARSNGQTRLNPADKLFLRLFEHQEDWERRIPVLASAVYTAINRELDEVEDSHELSYLEAMLEKL